MISASNYSMSEVTSSQSPLSVQLEALLFVAAEPVGIAELSQVLAAATPVIEAGLAQLEADLRPRGLRIQRHGGRFQLTTAPEFAGIIERFLGLEARSHLSRAALETLAIIAYNQPLTRPQIDAVRGVNSDSMLKSLLYKGLICELGRGPGVGRPILYATTPEFVQHLGLDSIADLPQLKPLEGEAEHDKMLKG
jgi:segregation and condensation protein B